MATPDNVRQFAEILFLNKICVEDDDIVIGAYGVGLELEIDKLTKK